MTKPGYRTIDVGNGDTVEVAAASVVRSRAEAGAPTGYRDVGGPNVHVREGFDRADYDWFRQGERLPTRDRDVIRACMQAYDQFPEVRNMVDLMADFSVRGFQIVHPRGKVERFGQEWAARVRARDRAERISSLLCRGGNTIAYRAVSALPDFTMDALRGEAAAAADPLPPNAIPTGYTILDPRTIEVVGGEFAAFSGPVGLRYAVRIPVGLSNRLQNPAAGESYLVGLVPDGVVDAATGGGRLVPLDAAKAVPLFYKKDDFQLWARPLLFPLLGHLQMYRKLMLADQAALDGAINHIRVWTLGDLEARLYPTEAAVNRLTEMLLNNPGGGGMDLIWGPDLKLTETSTEVHKFLGPEKYQRTLQAVYQGLGVPPSITGAAADGGLTNNAMGLKVLVERLEYLRQVQVDFWTRELEIVRRRFGFRDPFAVTFDYPCLNDEAAMRKLLMDLADRNYVSVEFLREQIGAVPEIEEVRVRREEKARREGKTPPRASPFHIDSQQAPTLERSFVQQGHLAPSQVGFDHPPPKAGEKTPFQLQTEAQRAQLAAKAKQLAAAPKPKKPGGRPTGAKDANPRKQKRVVPRTAAAFLWAQDALAAIERHTRDAVLAARGIGTLRELTEAQKADYEELKFAALFGLPAGEEVTREGVQAVVSALPPVPPEAKAVLRDAVALCGPRPPVEKVRQVRAAVYALLTDCPSETEEGPALGQDCD